MKPATAQRAYPRVGAVTEGGQPGGEGHPPPAREPRGSALPSLPAPDPGSERPAGGPAARRGLARGPAEARRPRGAGQGPPRGSAGEASSVGLAVSPRRAGEPETGVPFGGERERDPSRDS